MAHGEQGAPTRARQSLRSVIKFGILRWIGAALMLALAACALDVFAPSRALAQACTSPNDITCTVTGSQTEYSDFHNGSAASGTLIISSGAVFAADLMYFLNGENGNTGTLTIESGGTFRHGFVFLNAAGPGSIGIVIVRGTFDANSSPFIADFTNGAGSSTTGTIIIENGGVYNNASYFANGSNGTGTITIKNGGTFNNYQLFQNGSSGFPSSVGSVVIESGGTFFNDTAISFEQNALSSSSNAGTFINLGTLKGSTFTNAAGGVFQHFAGNALGASGTVLVGSTAAIAFNNAGTFNIGYSNASLATTALTGTYTQSSTGTLAIRADWAAGTSDKLAITGNATLAGTVVVTPLNFPSTAGLTKTFTDIITTTGTLDAAALTATNTAVVSYALAKRTNAIDLIASINFQGLEPGGLPPNQSNIAEELNTIYSSGTTLSFMPPLMELSTQGELSAALVQLTPSDDGAGNTGTMQTGATFAHQLLSCRTVGEGDANAIIREGQCVWARGTVRHASIGNSALSRGADETAPFYSAGGQFNIGGPWRVGGGIGYETSHLNSHTGSRTDTDRLHLGAVLKYNPGPLLLVAAVNGGLGWSDNERTVSFSGFNARATSDYESNFISGRLTAAYLLPFQRFYLKPQLDVAYTHISRDGYKEQGTGGIALAVAGSDDGVWSATPMLEIGAEVALAGGGVARPFLKGGMTWRDTNNFVTSSSFLDAPGSAPFAVTSRIDRVTTDIAAGVDIITPSDTTLRLQYDGQFGNMIEQHVGSAKLSVRF